MALFVERQEERLKTNNRDLSMASIVFSVCCGSNKMVLLHFLQ